MKEHEMKWSKTFFVVHIFFQKESLGFIILNLVAT